MTIYPQGTTVHCNRCDKPFPLTRERRGGDLGDGTARLEQFENCPHCGQTDSHWVYQRDYQNVVQH